MALLSSVIVPASMGEVSTGPFNVTVPLAWVENRVPSTYVARFRVRLRSAGKPAPGLMPMVPEPESVPPPDMAPVSREMVATSRLKLIVAAILLMVRLRRTSVTRAPSVVIVPVTDGAVAVPSMRISTAAEPLTTKPWADVWAASAAKGILPLKLMASGRSPARPSVPPPESARPPPADSVVSSRNVCPA